MIVKIDKTFEKDIDEVNDFIILKKIAKYIENFQFTENLNTISNIKKLKSSKDCYRIKIGNFRLGLIIKNNEVEFVRCLHRKDIYRFFPK
jgi:mRNA interferase RelE/StbE